MRMDKQTKKYVNIGLWIILAYFVLGLLKNASSSIASIFSMFGAKDQAGKSKDSPKAYTDTYGGDIDASKVEGIIEAIESSIHGWSWLGFEDDDTIIQQLNLLNSVAEIRYASDAFRSKYGMSLKARVVDRISSFSLPDIKALVTMNWT
jgi:hypothetical protein